MKMEAVVINPPFPEEDTLAPMVERSKWILPNHRMANQVMMRQIQKLDPFQSLKKLLIGGHWYHLHIVRSDDLGPTDAQVEAMLLDQARRNQALKDL